MNVFKKASWTKLATGRFQSITRPKDEVHSAFLRWSPVPHLLASNTPPSDDETALIHRAIAQTEASILENKKGHTHLEDADYEAILFIQHHRAILSGVRRIPTEIWQEIILWSVVGEAISEVEKSRWLLSHVSQAWRNASLSLSVLWAHLPTVTLDHEVHGRFERAQRQMEHLTEVLRRSGNRPLVVTIEDAEHSRHKTFYQHNRNKTLYPALSLLARHSDRWQTASISVPTVAMESLHHIRGRLPLLRTLALHLRLGYESTPMPLDMFEIAPLLRRVHISGSVPPRLKLPVSQLAHYKHLCITQGHLNHVVDYSALESLMISQKSYPISFSAATLKHLKRLEFVTDTPARDVDTLGCFDALKLPALEELTVAFPFYSPSIVPSLIRMLSNTGPAPSLLRTLRICPGTMWPGQLTMLLRLAPALVALDTTCPPHTDIERLAATTPQGRLTIVPLLRDCKFMFETVVDSFLDPRTRTALNRLALSRCEARVDFPMRLTVYSMSSHVHDVPWSQFKQCQLEDWTQSPAAMQLIRFSQSVDKLSRHVYNTRKLNKIMDDFNNIESMHIDNPQDIYISGIHVRLKHMCNVDGATNLSSDFIERIQAVLARWDSLLLPLLGDIHWICHGLRSVTYIPNNDGIISGFSVILGKATKGVGLALRTSSNALDIIYGLKDGMGVDDARWPLYLATYGISIYWPQKVGYFSLPI